MDGQTRWAKLFSQPVNLPSARPLMKSLIRYRNSFVVCKHFFLKSLESSSCIKQAQLVRVIMFWFLHWCFCSNVQGFWYFTSSRSHEFQVNPQNPTKFTKTLKILQNSLEIIPNICCYNIFETYLGCWSCLLAVNLQIYRGTSSLQQVNNIPKLPGILRLMLRKTGHSLWLQCKKLCHWCLSSVHCC